MIINVLYENPMEISEGKYQVYSFLKEHHLIKAKTENLYTTEKLKIKWVDLKTRNLSRLNKKLEGNIVFGVNLTKSLTVDHLRVCKDWPNEVIDLILKAYGEEEIVYIPFWEGQDKGVIKKKVHPFYKNPLCFSTKEEALKVFEANVRNKIQELEQLMQVCQRELTDYYEIRGEKPSSRSIYVINSRFLDGQIKENVGFAYDEATAEKQVKTLNSLRGAEEENIYYAYDALDEWTE